MAQTLEELFKSKQLTSQGGKTAAEAYDIRNSKDIRISTSDPLVNNTGFVPARLLRKTLGIKGSESLLEEEVTGLRVIRGFSTPVIYGSELGRITLRTTPSLDLMKTATMGELSDDGGLIGKGLSKLTGGKVTSATDLKNKVNGALTKLGVPQTATPTFVVNALKAQKVGETQSFILGQTQDRTIDLALIKNSAEGTLIGKALKDGLSGNLKTIGKQVLGSAIKLGKQELRKKLFGGGERTGLAAPKITVSNRSVTGFTEDSAKWANAKNFNYGYLGGFPESPEANPKNDPTEHPQKLVDKDGSIYSKTIDPTANTAENRNDLSYKQQLDYAPLTEWRKAGADIAPITFSKTPDRIGKFSEVGSLVNYDITKNLEEFQRGFKTKSDTINEQGVYTGESFGTLDDADFIPLKFYSLYLGKTAQFRCTVNGLSETFSPSWDSYKFLGSPFNNYTYSGIERSVTFNFKVYSLNAKEHKVVWDKLNFLTGLVYPQGYYDTSALVPPFIKFTLGDLFNGKLGFIESLSYTYDDNTPWNINNKEKTVNYNTGDTATGLSADINMKGYKLPMIVDVAVTIKFLESRGITAGRKFFNFNPQTS